MNLHIPLSQEAEAKLREQALAAGKDVDTFLLETINRILNIPTISATQVTPFVAGEACDSSGVQSGLLGLFADEADLVEDVLESAYENRSRPLRVE